MVSRSKLAARESAMRILCSYGGMESAFAIQQPQVVVGRASCSEAVDLDLAPDLKVSRRHARIWTEGGKYWIEDLNSSWGTQVNGIGIRGKGRWSLGPGDSVLIGDTTLRLEILDPEASPQDSGAPCDERRQRFHLAAEHRGGHQRQHRAKTDRDGHVCTAALAGPGAGSHLCGQSKLRRGLH